MTVQPLPHNTCATPAPHTGSTLTHAGTAGTACISSTTLLGGSNAIVIEHQGNLYRLQATRSGKLILTK